MEACEELANPPYEAVSFRIISFAGTAKSSYLEAIELAKQGIDPSALIAQGDEAFRIMRRSRWRRRGCSVAVCCSFMPRPS